MTDTKRRRAAFIAAIVLNVLLIIAVISSVLFALRDAESASFNQNIANVKTLTDSAANKVQLELMHHEQELGLVADYVNSYNEAGMTENEIIEYFRARYGKQEEYTWQLVNAYTSDAEKSNEGFMARSLSNGESGFRYRIDSYHELAKIFCLPSQETLGTQYCSNEFTNTSSATEKSFALLTAVRIREEGKSEYEYRTLMLILKSAKMNSLISSNNDIDTLSYFDYSGIIIDDSGSYVISSSAFQGKSITDYIALYNSDFTQENADTLFDGLATQNYTETLYYKNNKDQDCVYTIVPVQNSTWHILSVVPLSSFSVGYEYSSNYLRFFLTFALLFAVDMVLVLILNKQLRRKKKEAEAANKAKSQFLSSMSHDIRTPMNAIIGMTVIAKENLAEEKPDKDTIADCIKTIELSGNHLLTLINDILDISKIESGRVELTADDFSISETMSGILDIIQPAIKEKSFDFQTHIINVNHEFVHADELRIKQIYINILSNAIKYTGTGGRITVDLCEEPAEGRTDAAKFIYTVSDTGIGMSEEFQKTIFDRFTRAVDTRINTVQGTGLGMAIVKQLVDLMGGTITVSSKLNEGSTFTVTLILPVADVNIESVSLTGHSALLIDDDRILLETAEFVLAKAGMLVETAMDGITGIGSAVTRQESGKPYDVILVDWKMAEVGGIEVVKTLRVKLGRNAKIIVMTAYNIADIEREARAAGVDGFISKPLFRSKLLHTIQAAITSSKEEKPVAAQLSFDLNVLVAEDNLVNWKVLRKLLTRYGLEPDRAENGEIALQMVRDGEKRYDLILMDVQMPVMNGYEATAAIRALENKAKAVTPIYAMTADTFAEDISKAMESGMNGHLAKPVEIDKLVKVLTALTDEKNSAKSES